MKPRKTFSDYGREWIGILGISMDTVRYCAKARTTKMSEALQ